MNPIRILVVSSAAALLALASCNDSNAAGKTGDHATKSVENTAEHDGLSKLSPEALKTKAIELTDELGRELSAVRDSEGAKTLVAKFQPIVDELNKVKSTLMSQQFDMSALKQSVSDAIERLGGNKEVIDVLQPLIDKIKALVQ